MSWQKHKFYLKKSLRIKCISSLLILTAAAFTAPLIQAAPGDILYQNNFNSAAALSSDWTRQGGNNRNDFEVTTSVYNSAGSSLRIRDESGGISDSGLIDASGVSALEVSIWVQSGTSGGTDPDPGDDLELYYSDSGGTFNLLYTFPGTAAATTVFEEVITLPADAFHSDLRFRFEMTGGGNNERWFVDDFIVREPDDGSGGGIEYIEISTDGSALTCTSEDITLRACANSDCSTVASEDVIVTLAVTGSATFDTNPVTIPANSSSGVSVTLTDRTAETVTISVSSTSVATSGTSPQCSNTTCQVSFADSGYLLSLPNHNSCAGSSLSIQAVQLSDTGVSCAPAYTGNQSVGFEFNYLNPVSGSTIPVLDSSTMGSAGATQVRTINFDGTASASLPFSYDDAGQISVTVSDQGSNGLTSSTVNTVVTPAQLLLYTNDANNACTGADYGSCTAFKTAGIPGDASSEFDLTISGACADNTVTPNFVLSSIALSSNLVAPSSGTNGSLGVTSVDITSGGTATVSQTISEVGAFSITATPGSYLGESIPAATSSTIGRFTPDRFLISDNSPMLDDATCDFTYQAQQAVFAPGLAPEITVTAVNSNGATTVNYGGDSVSNNDFWNFNTADYSGRTYSNQASPYPGSITAALDSVTIAGETNYDGVHTITFANDAITHNKAGVTPETTNDAPFDAQVLLTLTAASLTDADSIFYDADGNGVADSYESTTIDGTNIRWGRWSLENGFGSELQAISVNLTAQYFNGTQFITATTDNCTAAVTIALSNYTGNLSVGETTASQSAITSGIIPISLSAPGAGNTGSVIITVTTPAWLTYDYDGDGTAENAQASATFGIYEGRRPIILRRQTY